MKAAIDKAIGDRKVQTGKVNLDLPALVENGNTVAVTVKVDSPMKADRSRQGHPPVQREEPAAQYRKLPSRAARRPVPRSRPASGSPTPRTIIAIAEMNDGSFWQDSSRSHRDAGGLPGGSVMARALINVPPKSQGAATSSRSRP